MKEIDEIYHETIIDHYRKPRNIGPPAEYTHHGYEINPLCGDEVDLWVNIVMGVISSVHLKSKGCALCVASASILTEEVKNCEVEEGIKLFDKMRAMIVDGKEQDISEKLKIFEGVHSFPARVKCVIMSWHLLKNILEQWNEEHA